MASQVVDVFFHELICDNATDGTGNRDEVYIRVIGSAPTGNISTRLPRSHHRDGDYYQFLNHQVSQESKPETWRVQDDAIVGKPYIWSGRLEPEPDRDTAGFFIVISEQDPTFNGPVFSGIQKALEQATAAAGSNSPVANELTTATILANALAEFKDDVIGAFYLSITSINNGSDLKTVWIPLKEVRALGLEGSTTLPNPQNYYALNLSAGKKEVWRRPLPPHHGPKKLLGYTGLDLQSFTFSSLGKGLYRGTIAVRWTNVGPIIPKAAYRYRITEFDACSKNALLRVYDLNLNTFRFNQATPILRPGNVASTRVSSSTWYWKCFVPGKEKEKGLDNTTAGVATIRFIYVERSDDSGQIRWYCFSEEDWS